MRVASTLVAVSLVLLVLEAVLRFAKGGTLGPYSFVGLLWIGMYGVGFFGGLRDVRRDDRYPVAWWIVAGGSLLQAITYVAHTLTLLLLTLADRPYRPGGFSSTLPPAAEPYVYAAGPALLVLGPILGFIAWHRVQHGKLLWTTNLVISLPFWALVAVATLA